jgi:hypothetical protein
MAANGKGPYVVIRTYSAGVHVGELIKRTGKEVALANARRIWSWQGALSLSEISQTGITGGKVSCVVPSIELTEAIEIIPCSKSAELLLRKFRVWQP